MGYIKIDDRLSQHPKMLRAMFVDSHAFGLYVAAACYSNLNRTDGFVPAPQLSALLPTVKRPKPAARALVDARLWHDVDGGYAIHDYLEHQASADQIGRRLRKDSTRKKNGSRVEEVS